MKRFLLLTAICVLAAQPVLADEDLGARPRLVPGGVDIAQGDKRIEVFSMKGLSFGTLSPLPTAPSAAPARMFVPSATGTLFDKLALGGYVTYSDDAYGLTTAVRSRNGLNSADLSASTGNSLMGYPGSAAITLGYDWRNPSSIFSPNAQISGLEAFDSYTSGPSVSLSWNHSITPGFYFGGYASAQRTTPQAFDFITQPSNKFLLGASVGLKF